MSDFRVYAIRYARRDALRGEHFHGHDATGTEPHPTSYYVWLAVSDRHTVLIDTGISRSRAETVAGLDYLASPAERLAELGVPAESVGHVVLTHLHYDHTGTAHEFTGARYVLQRAELDYWTGPWASRITRERWLLNDDDLARLQEAGKDGRVTLVDGDAEVVPGLSVHLVGGHTAGMQVVRVRTARGHVVLASDASHFYENLEDDRPFPILHSMTGMYAAFDRVKELADGPHLVVAGHDPEVLDRFPLLRPDIAVIATGE
ncbi:Glyoxylase, beta-lactamase superfamily II [Nonomuraea solani]|uniref:Glyoxylase, beta-lactamase superfamily II n=1 Tax=Nonomuraea solani TaxID=1144553 RepID=A0A1H6DTF1_9ACTN|nr:N-acyl homoserine lactonase family protein [Nonomuraea solani]SEG88033.1 Glyoxylase, beta-lactamase superfamily II [Nonomuraea solani]